MASRSAGQSSFDRRQFIRVAGLAGHKALAGGGQVRLLPVGYHLRRRAVPGPISARES